MSEGSGTIFEDALEALTFSRQGTIAEARNIPDDRWDFRPHPDAYSVADLVRHITEATAMLTREASDPEGDFKRRPPREHLDAHDCRVGDGRSPAELKAALEASHEENVRRIRAGESHMTSGIRRFDGGTWNRLTYLFHAASHEDYHRGQLATYARSMGLVPALTQRIRGRKAE